MSKVKSVLGKGLSALIPSVGDDDTYEEEQRHRRERAAATQTAPIAQNDSVSAIELAQISSNPFQPRKDFPREALDELIGSIKEHGIIQAITVRSSGGGKYELVSGERRVRAAIEAGLKKIPAYVIEANSNAKMLEYAIIENVQRSQFNPIEEAEAYERLIIECGLTQEEVAEKIAKDRTTISNFLRLLKLPEPIRTSLRGGALGMGHAKAIMGVPDSTRQIELWQQAIRESLSVRKLEELARDAVKEYLPKEGAAKKQGRPSKPNAEDQFRDTRALEPLENRVKQLLGTQIRVKMKQDGAGDITIQFYTEDDLERIFELLLSIPADSN
jgi:ParB family chromosome partitioning protein